MIDLRWLPFALLTLALAVTVIRDLAVGVTSFGRIWSLRYVKAENPIGYGCLILGKLGIMLFCGAAAVGGS